MRENVKTWIACACYLALFTWASWPEKRIKLERAPLALYGTWSHIDEYRDERIKIGARKVNLLGHWEDVRSIDYKGDKEHRWGHYYFYLKDDRKEFYCFVLEENGTLSVSSAMEAGESRDGSPRYLNNDFGKYIKKSLDCY